MVKPREQDVVFVEDLVDGNQAAHDADCSSEDPFSTPQKQQTQPSSSPPSSETTGNRIYKKLLTEYYDEYFHGYKNNDTSPGSISSCCPLAQQKVRKMLLERFHEEMAAAFDKLDTASQCTSTSPNSASSSPSKPQFLLHRKQGKSFCFTKVFFKPNIDQKIKESFERMRRDHGGSVDTYDSGPVRVITTPPVTTKSKPAELGDNESQNKSSNQESSVESPIVPMATAGAPNSTINNEMAKIGSDAKIPGNSNSSITISRNGGENSKHIDANEKAAMMNQKASLDANDKKQQGHSNANAKTINDDTLDDDKTFNPNCSEMTSKDVASLLAMEPKNAKDASTAAGPAAAANTNSNNIQMEQESSSHSQAPGCETGETGNENSPSTRLAETEPFVRKRGRNFLWKESPAGNSNSNSEPNSPRSSCKKPKLHDDDVTLNKSNWGKLREQLFRFVRPQKSQDEDTEASLTIQVDDNLPAVDSNGLLPMHEILVSPYEGNRSAEIGEEPLDRWKKLMKPFGDDHNEMNPLLSDLYGDPLAKTIFSAKIEIASLQHLFETSWKWGKIGRLSLGWIPKRQLLLCLDENKILSPTTVATPVAKHNANNDKKDSEDDEDSDEKLNNDNDDNSDDEEEKESKSDADGDDADDDDDEEEDDERDSETEALVKVARKLECFELVICLMREWKLKYEYPELYSCKDGGEYIFQTTVERNNGSESETSNNDNDDDKETKKNCYKCLIFVARVFCALLLFNEEKKAPASLMQKVRACLAVMNTHARAHPGELARILKKKKRKQEGPKPKISKKRRTRTIVGSVEEREATLMASFGHVKKESETLLQMMDYYKMRLLLVTPEKNDDHGDEEHNSSHFHRHMSFMESMEEEIVSNAKREFARERRFRKKVALARQTR